MDGKRWGIVTAAVAVVLFTAAAAFAQETRPANPPTTVMPLSETDRHFIMEAARGGDHEVELGDMARQKGQSAAVKQFGARMVQDHGKAGQEVRQLARSKGVRLTDTGTAHKEPSVDRLAKVSPAEFDREYVNAMVQDHEKDVAEFRRMSQTATDPDVRAWAAKTLPTLEDHLATIKSIKGNMTGSTR
jgi:putative membrane protein